MNKNLLYRSLVTFFLIVPIQLIAQRKIKDGDKVFYYDKSDNLKKIDFIDNAGKIKGSYQVQGSDPFLSRTINDDSTGAATVSSVSNISEVSYYAGKNFSVVCYDNHSGSKTRAVCFVINNEGKIVYRLPESNTGYNTPVVTTNGKYVGVLYGSPDPHQTGEENITSGFKIYDVVEREFILDYVGPVGGPVVVDDKIIITINNDTEKIYKVYVPGQKIMFEKGYKRSERNYIQFTSKGFMLKNSAGIQVFHDYATYFKAIPFNQ